MEFDMPLHPISMNHSQFLTKKLKHEKLNHILNIKIKTYDYT